jgi:hypothetical protein
MQMEFWHKKVKVWAWIILPRLGRQIELESKAVIDRIHEIKILKKGKQLQLYVSLLNPSN